MQEYPTRTLYHKNTFVYNSIMLAPIHLVLVSNEHSLKELCFLRIVNILFFNWLVY
jgi:hypothetical protein